MLICVSLASIKQACVSEMDVCDIQMQWPGATPAVGIGALLDDEPSGLIVPIPGTSTVSGSYCALVPALPACLLSTPHCIEVRSEILANPLYLVYWKARSALQCTLVAPAKKDRHVSKSPNL